MTMTATALPLSVLPRLRRLPVPASEPPYDDELADGWTPDRHVARWSAGRAYPGQGALALDYLLPSGLPATPAVPPGLALVPDLDDDDWAAPVPTPSAELPDPRVWSGRFTQALVEVLSGDRPVAQLLRMTSPAIYDQLVHLIAAGRSHGRSVVRSVHVGRPDDGVAEVAVLVHREARSFPVALRIEGFDGHWRCTALELDLRALGLGAAA